MYPAPSRFGSKKHRSRRRVTSCHRKLRTKPAPALPIVDLGNTTSARLGDVSRQVGEAAQSGFFYVKNHGVSEHLVEVVPKLGAEFFGRSDGLKTSFTTDRVRGYKNNSKECLYFVQDNNAWYNRTNPCHQLNGVNLWPNGRFESAYLEYVEKMTNVGALLMSLVAQDFGLESNYFEPFMFNSYWRMTVTDNSHSNSSKQKINPTTTDVLSQPGCFVIVNHNGPGLASKHGNDWVDIPPIPGTLLVCVGDVLSHWSNHKYKKTNFVLKNMPNNKNNTVLTSFFYEPNYSALVYPVNTKPTRARDVSPLVYGDYLVHNIPLEM